MKLEDHEVSDIMVVEGEKDFRMSLGFQVADVKKPLVAVKRIVEKGNVVSFGPKEEDNFIRNVESGKKINMVHKGGSYVIEADYVMQEPGFPRPVGA